MTLAINYTFLVFPNVSLCPVTCQENMNPSDLQQIAQQIPLQNRENTLDLSVCELWNLTLLIIPTYTLRGKKQSHNIQNVMSSKYLRSSLRNRYEYLWCQEYMIHVLVLLANRYFITLQQERISNLHLCSNGESAGLTSHILQTQVEYKWRSLCQYQSNIYLWIDFNRTLISVSLHPLK